MSSERRVVLGRIAGAFGVDGRMRVESWTQPFDGLRRYNPWLIGRNGEYRRYEVEELIVTGRRLVARLQGVADRDEARRLYGSEIAAEADQLESLPEGEYYWFQLKGLRVVNERGESLGRVDDLTDTGAHSILVVRDDARERLIPYVKGEIVRRVDLNEGLVEVEWEADW